MYFNYLSFLRICQILAAKFSVSLHAISAKPENLMQNVKFVVYVHAKLSGKPTSWLNACILRCSNAEVQAIS